MGQRLVLSIIYGDNDDEKERVIGYYHWSGYTDSSTETTIKALEYINEVSESLMDLNHHTWQNCVDLCSIAIKALEYTGAGIDDKERDRINQLFPEFKKYEIKDAIDRNEGLIFITPFQIKEAMLRSNNLSIINLINRTVDIFDLFDNVYDPNMQDEDYDTVMMRNFYEKQIMYAIYRDGKSDNPVLTSHDIDQYAPTEEMCNQLVDLGLIDPSIMTEPSYRPIKLKDIPLVPFNIFEDLSFDEFQEFYDIIKYTDDPFKTPDGYVYRYYKQ